MMTIAVAFAACETSELAAQPIYQEQPPMTSVMELIMAGGFTPVAFEPFFQSQHRGIIILAL